MFLKDPSRNIKIFLIALAVTTTIGTVITAFGDESDRTFFKRALSSTPVSLHGQYENLEFEEGFRDRAAILGSVIFWTTFSQGPRFNDDDTVGVKEEYRQDGQNKEIRFAPAELKSIPEGDSCRVFYDAEQRIREKYKSQVSLPCRLRPIRAVGPTSRVGGWPRLWSRRHHRQSGAPCSSRSWRRAGTRNAYATGFVQNGQKLRRGHRYPPLQKTQRRGTLNYRWRRQTSSKVGHPPRALIG
jgi:hypothetical protein